MLTQSRPIRKCVKPEFMRSKAHKKKKLVKEDPKKSQRCKYQVIPLETKVVHSEHIECLHGDLPLVKVGETLAFDISFLNEFKVYRELQTMEIFDQKAITIKAEDKTMRDTFTWMKFVDDLKECGSAELGEWAKVIQTFCLKYQRILCQPRKKAKSDGRRSYFNQVTGETEAREKELFQNHSCIQLRYRLKNNRNQLNQVVFTERMLREMGYSTDDFASVVLQEGIPQIFAFETFPHNYGIRELMNKYFLLGVKNYETEEFDSYLCLRYGYGRKIKVKGFYSMNYENNLFGIDVTLAVTSIGEPIFQYSRPVTLNEKFVQDMILNEAESENFFSFFYDAPTSHKYTNLYKTCKVKEIL